MIVGSCGISFLVPLVVPAPPNGKDALSLFLFQIEGDISKVNTNPGAAMVLYQEAHRRSDAHLNHIRYGVVEVLLRVGVEDIRLRVYVYVH